jgi:hypothetical protein
MGIGEEVECWIWRMDKSDILICHGWWGWWGCGDWGLGERVEDWGVGDDEILKCKV